MRHGLDICRETKAIIRAKRHLVSLSSHQLLAITDIHSVSCHITSIFLIISPKSIQTSQGKCLDLEDFPFSPLMSHFVVVVPAIHSRIQEDPDQNRMN